MIKSPINYNGNKYKILKHILDVFPDNINTFVDVFGGSGVVSLNVQANKIVYNDIVFYISDVLKGIKESESFDIILDEINKIIEKYNLSKENEEGFLKIREDYNNGDNNWIMFFVLICYSFNTQYRFNNKHQYNSSFGRNKSHFSSHTQKKLELSYNRLQEINISFQNEDFRNIDFSSLTKDDFVYLDPPYFGTTGNYNDGKRGFLGWNDELENALRTTCEHLNKCGVKFAMSNNLATNLTLEDWCIKNNFNIIHIDNNYNNSSYNKMDKTVDDEAVITNYI